MAAEIVGITSGDRGWVRLFNVAITGPGTPEPTRISVKVINGGDNRQTSAVVTTLEAPRSLMSADEAPHTYEIRPPVTDEACLKQVVQDFAGMVLRQTTAGGAE